MRGIGIEFDVHLLDRQLASVTPSCKHGVVHFEFAEERDIGIEIAPDIQHKALKVRRRRLRIRIVLVECVAPAPEVNRRLAVRAG